MKGICTKCGSRFYNVVSKEDTKDAKKVWEKINAEEEEIKIIKGMELRSKRTILSEQDVYDGDNEQIVEDSLKKLYGMDDFWKDDYLGLPIRLFLGTKITRGKVTGKYVEATLPHSADDKVIVFYGENDLCPICGARGTILSEKEYEEYKQQEILNELALLKESAGNDETKSVNTEIDPQQFLKCLVDVSQNIYMLENRLKELISERNYRQRVIYRMMTKAKKESQKMDALPDVEKEIKRLQQKLCMVSTLDSKARNEMIAQSGIISPTFDVEEPVLPCAPAKSRSDLVEPQKPTLKTPGLFNKAKINQENQIAVDRYEKELNDYTIALAEINLYEKEKKIYDEKVLEFEKEKAKYNEELKEYEQAVNNYIQQEKERYFREKNQQVQTQLDNLVKQKAQLTEARNDKDYYLSFMDEKSRKGFNSHKAIFEFYSAEIKEDEELLKQQYRIINTLCASETIFPKYNNVVAWSTMYEYFVTGRVSELSGPNGAYNLYESEVRANIIISKLDAIIDRLDAIKDNQYVLYQLVNEATETIKDIGQKTKLLLEEMVDQGSDLSAIRLSQEQSAYNTAKTAYNTNIIAKTNKAIAFMKAIWG